MDAKDGHEEALPSSMHEHVGTLSEFYARHVEKLTSAQRIVERISVFLGSPRYVAGNLAFVVLWIA